MKFGAGFPLSASSDGSSIREFAQTLDAAEFDYVTTAGHLLGVPQDRFTDRPPATYAGPFHDPFVLFGYLAAITGRLRFRPTILILPLYPTAIVAKQSAELQLLSDGRFELGVGLSWNTAEYRALGQDFSTRGKRVEEQIEVLRRTWSEPYVSYSGRWHEFDEVGLNRPVSPPIPIWMGSGTDERVLRRVARLADGWLPLADPTAAWPRLRQYVEEAGRDPATFGLTTRVVVGPGGEAAWVESARAAAALGASHVTLSSPPELAGAAALERLVAARRAIGQALGG